MQESIPQATGNLRALQLRMTEILLEVDKVCRNNGIRYWIEYGTLLGAVRHGGFIPWDDDTDICVLEDDFDKFIEVCNKSLPDWLYVQTEKNEPCSGMGGGLIKIRDRRSLYINDFDSFKLDYNKGIFVDVFKSINCPKMPKSLFRYLSKRISLSYGFYHYPCLISFRTIVCYFLYPISYLFHKGIFNFFYLFGKSDKYFFTPERYSYGLYSSKDAIFPLKEIEYEGHKVMGPANPDQCLRDIYGDYMKIPEKSCRRTHAVCVLVDEQVGKVSY
jgi:lipopolysaccharide cholinephosphotransferase